MVNKRSSFFSRAYGLLIQSEFSLLKSSIPKPHWPNTPRPDLIIRQGEADEFQDPGDGFSVINAEIQQFGKFLMREGRELVISPAPDRCAEDLRAIILGSALSVILQQRHQLVLHASAVSLQHQAVAFLGNSGWGKSTLVSALHAKGHDFMTDDVLAIDLQQTPPHVMPSYPEVRLRPDTIESLGNTFDLEDSQRQSHWKTEKLVEQRVAVASVPLLGLYILGFGHQNEVQTVPSHQAFLEISHHSRAMRVIHRLDVKGLRASHFKQAMQLCQLVPIFYLRRRRSLDEMPQVITLIEQHVEDLLTQT